MVDPIDPIGVSQIIWPTHELTHPQFITPGRHENMPMPQEYRANPYGKPGQPLPEEAPFDALVEPEAPKAPPPVPGKDLRHVLLDAGVRGIGPIGAGYELSPRELTDAAFHAYRRIAVSLQDTLAQHHELPLQLVGALSVDARAERELGALLILDDRLQRHLAMVVNPGILNRLHKAGEGLLDELKRQPGGIIAALTLIEAPGRRWSP